LFYWYRCSVFYVFVAISAENFIRKMQYLDR